MTVFIFQF